MGGALQLEQGQQTTACGQSRPLAVNEASGAPATGREAAVREELNSFDEDTMDHKA